MDPDQEREYNDQGPVPHRDVEEDTQILTKLLKLTFPSCMNGDATASGKRYQRACKTQMADFWQEKLYLENYDVSRRDNYFK